MHQKADQTGGRNWIKNQIRKEIFKKRIKNWIERLFLKNNSVILYPNFILTRVSTECIFNLSKLWALVLIQLIFIYFIGWTLCEVIIGSCLTSRNSWSNSSMGSQCIRELWENSPRCKKIPLSWYGQEKSRLSWLFHCFLPVIFI